MSVLSQPTRFLPVLGGAVLLASVAVLLLPVPGLVQATVPALVAIGVGVAQWRGADAGRRDAESRDADLAQQLEAARKANSELRHDIRGCLSPALLNADRLSTHPEAGVRRAADTMIGTIERIEARLKQG